MSEMRVIKNPKLSADELTALDGAPVLDPDDLDEAIMGTTKNDSGDVVLVYSIEALVEVYTRLLNTGNPEDDEMAAEEWVGFNTLRAIPYMGPRAPIVLSRLYEGFCEGCPDDDTGEFEFQGKRWLRQA